RQLYAGEGRRPNTLLWLLTVNGAALSKDLAQRCVPVKLKRPAYRGSWEAEVDAFIDAHRWAVIGDILAALRAPAAPLARHTRWGMWEDAGLARLGDPAGCQDEIERRQNAIDDDEGEKHLVREAFVEVIREAGHDPAATVVLIPSATAADVVNRATGEPRAV